jgi:tryptophan synthase alpha chain
MGVSRIEQRFSASAKKPVLVVYLTVGDPSVEDTLGCALAALEAGADMLELGVPFSDPTADGPVIAAASYRAIQRGGSLRSAIGVAEKIRKVRSEPLILFTYYNPVVAFGEEAAVDAADRAGVDGLLVVDLPPEEGATLRRAAASKKLAMIPLIAPTTGPEREPRVLAGASGFAYYVSVTGVTGAKAPLEEAGREAAVLRKRAGLPVVVGFGIRTPENARTVVKAGVDGVVVGTEVVRVMSEAATGEARQAAVRDLVGRLRAGLDDMSR